jgi:hypothetical protein
MRAALHDGRFYPFEWHLHSDFDIDEAGALLDIDRVRKELLHYMLRNLEIQIWFDDGKDNCSEPFLELNVFWLEKYVSGVDISELMGNALSGDGTDIGPEKEIAALTALRDRLNTSIDKRLQQAGK